MTVPDEHPRLLDQCQWPPLPEHYASALREAVAYILKRFSPHSLVACGTIIRGSPDPSSDFDLYVLHDAPWRQRVQKWFQGVPAEIFVNPPHQIERYFEEEQPDGRPMTAHMLASGFIILDTKGAAAHFQQRARHIIGQLPNTSKAQLLFLRYGTATIYEDAADIAARSPENASLLLGVALNDMLRYAFLSANRPVPRHKEMLKSLEGLDPELARLTYAYFRSETLPERLELAGQIADRTIGARGFFEWETPPQEV